MSLQPKIKYLNNRELLSAIHESKSTFCEFEDPKYANYDIIVGDLASVTPEIIEAARHKKLANIIADGKREHGKTFETDLTVDDMFPQDIVVRLMTFEHIPMNPLKEGKAKTEADAHIRCNFPPYQHWIMENGAWKLVGQSHYKNGEFNLVGGRVTNRMGAMWMKLVERYARRSNWRGYSYNDEMQATALAQLAQVGLQFNEARGSNPFSFLTQCINTSFIKVLNSEKRVHNTRDILLILNNQMPSNSMVLADQLAQQEAGVVADAVVIVDTTSAVLDTNEEF